MPPVAPSSSTWAMAGRRSPIGRWRPRQARLAYAHGSVFTNEPLEAYAAAVGPPPAPRRPGDLPGLGWLRGDRDRAQARPRVPPRARRDRPLDRLLALGRATTATRSARSTSPVASRLRRPYEGWLGRFRHVSAAYPYRAGLAGCECPRTGRRAGRRAGSGIRGRRAGDRGRVRRGADRRRDPRRGRPAGRLLARDRRVVPPARRPADRRRGDDRLRADRALVRARSLGRPARPARRCQGRDVGLLAVRVRGGLGRDPRHASTGGGPGFVHGFTYSHGPVAAAVAGEVLRILETRGPRRGQRLKGERLLAALRATPAERIRTSARSAVAACSSAWSSSPTARRGSHSRGRRG